MTMCKKCHKVKVSAVQQNVRLVCVFVINALFWFVCKVIDLYGHISSGVMA